VPYFLLLSSKHRGTARLFLVIISRRAQQ